MRTIAVIAFLAVLAGLVAYSAAGTGGRKEPGGSRAAAEAPCPEVDAPEVSPPTYDQPPALELQEGDYSAIIRTSCGEIEVDLLEDAAPRTVANFVFLAEEGFYDGLTWLRIERDFVIQTGDPDGIIGNDIDGPGYTIDEERPPSARKYVYGVVAMANDGPGTSGSQFFIVVHDPVEKREPAGLEPEYSIFGRVSEESYETLDKIARMPVMGGDDVHTAVQPRSPVVIESVEITTT
ncbi:MAG: peptidylprolyl isomerase [Actinobacteria bacterium]|nr:peptidylprolyl isomerase [Actinomycetota bacterium]